MEKIVTFTLNPAIDKSSRVEHVIAENKLYCDNPRYEPGGGGINVSRAINKLGEDSLLLYTSGGFTGQRLGQLLKNEGLNERAIKIENSTRENLIIMENSTNLQYRFGMPGPEINKNEIKKMFDILSNLNPIPEYLVISGSIPVGVPDDIYAKMAKRAKEKGIKVVVDVSGAPLKEVMEEGVFLIKPNLGEFQDLVDREVMEDDEIKEAAFEMIKDNCCSVVVISLGAGGVLFVTEDQAKFMRPPTVPIKSKVGAGDSMLAGIVLSLAKGNSLESSIIYGLAAGSSAVMTPGTELCKKEDTDRLYKKMITNFKK
jgi:6-phosphofructokinase 2